MVNKSILYRRNSTPARTKGQSEPGPDPGAGRAATAPLGCANREVHPEFASCHREIRETRERRRYWPASALLMCRAVRWRNLRWRGWLRLSYRAGGASSQTAGNPRRQRGSRDLSPAGKMPTRGNMPAIRLRRETRQKRIWGTWIFGTPAGFGECRPKNDPVLLLTGGNDFDARSASCKVTVHVRFVQAMRVLAAVVFVGGDLAGGGLCLRSTASLARPGERLADCLDSTGAGGGCRGSDTGGPRGVRLSA